MPELVLYEIRLLAEQSSTWRWTSLLQADHLDCTGEGGSVHVVVMSRSSLLEWTEGSWSSQPHSLDLSQVSHLGFVHRHQAGWRAAGLISEHGTRRPELFLLTRDSWLTSSLPDLTGDLPDLVTCQLDSSGSLVSLAYQDKVDIISATTGARLGSRDVSPRLSGVHWCSDSNILLLVSSDGTLVFTSRTLGKSNYKNGGNDNLNIRTS